MNQNETCDRIVEMPVVTPAGKAVAFFSYLCQNPVYLDTFIEGNPGEMPFMTSLCSKHYAMDNHIDDPDVETWTPIVGIDA